MPRSGVLRVITRLNIGGPARQALLLTRALQPEYPTVLAAGTTSAVEGELSDPEVAVRHVPLVRPIRPPTDGRALVAVRRLLIETRPAVVHSHMSKAGTVARLAALSVTPRPKIVHTFHGHVLDGYFSSPVQALCVSVERKLARHADALIAVSPQIRDALLSLGIGRAGQFHVMPAAIELTSFLSVTGPSGLLRSRLGLGPEVPLIGVLGRLVPIKDNSVLLESMTHLPGVHLAVMGDGEERSSLERRARQLGVAGRVHFTGWWPDVAAAISDLDAVALSSRNEGTPVALIEAAATGVPAVATAVGGVPHVVRDGVTGYLVEPGQPVQLAERLHRLLVDTGARARMGKAAREHVRYQFGHDRLVQGTGSLYDDLLRAPSAARVDVRLD